METTRKPKKMKLSKGLKKEKVKKSFKPKESILKNLKHKSVSSDGKRALKSDNRKRKSGLDKNSMECLKEIDPELYDFLKKNDKKLLEFNVFDSDEDGEDVDDKVEVKQSKGRIKKEQNSDSESDDDIDDVGDDADTTFDIDTSQHQDGTYHKTSGKLEVASDESDFEEEDTGNTAPDGTQKVTLNLLRQWQLELEKPNASVEVVRKVIEAFSSALASITTDAGEATHTATKFKVVGAGIFNGIVQLCVLHLQPAVLRILGVTARSNMPLHKTKKWAKVRSCLRYYLTDLIHLVEQVSSVNILSVLLKHLHQMSGMVGSFSTLGKTILKRLIVLWSSADETVRVLAFLCILKITRNQQKSMLNHVLKAMYLSYIRNSKFVSPNTLPNINFMRRSLVEMFALDINVSYQHAFLYIRQLAIHLRNAVILKKKDSVQSVYNWQYVNSLRLWADLLGATANKPQLQALVYPLVTITTGVIRLVPTAQYFPLRFHCLQALISLCKDSNIFIPVLPLILEVLRSNNFNKKHTKVSMRPMQFTCILRLNKTQLAENGFRDEVVEQVCSLSLEYLAHESASLAFSDLIVPAVKDIKAYLKTCRNANYSRKLKTLLDKIHENSNYIDQERRKLTFGLDDNANIVAWETQLHSQGTPLSIYYENWVKTHDIKKRRQAAHTEDINDDYDLPKIKRVTTEKMAAKRRQTNKNGGIELFPSDSEDNDTGLHLRGDESEDEPVIKPKKRKARNSKTTKESENSKKLKHPNECDVPVEEEDGLETVDIVKDLDLNDW